LQPPARLLFPYTTLFRSDFPCISGSRVGQGRVYVQLGKPDKVDYAKWCEGLAKGRSYISDGYSHALEFTVNDQPAGGEVKLDARSEEHTSELQSPCNLVC